MAATYSSLVGLAVGGKYEIRRVLGVGGMGVVCEALHADLGKKVAIKLIDKTMKESEAIVARFRREARAAGQIQSEHIVTVFDVGADARVGLYMVMEQLSGEDLQTRLDRERRLDVRTAVMIAHQIARGLQKAHEVGVVHRDLKPANVFLTERDNGQLLVKLLDFGVSKLLGDEPGSARITGSGAPIGTPLYMSPEQAEGKSDTDGRADIWSLGAVLYEALAGVPPFQDRGSYHGTIVGILTSRPKLLHDAAPWVPSAVAKVVDAMLVHDRDARIKDAATVSQRLIDAFPAVLPDGTGRHTAIVLSQQNAVDATGDTEFFSATGVNAALRAARTSDVPERSSRPAPSSPRQSGPVSAEDSSKTVPDPPAPSSDGDVEASSAARRTAAATPVHASEQPAAERETDPVQPVAEAAAPQVSTAVMKPYVPTPAVSAPPPAVAEAKSGASPSTAGALGDEDSPRTQPTWTSPGSSARGVAMPGTPPVIEPLPQARAATADVTGDYPTSAPGAGSWGTKAAVAVAIVAVAIGGYVLGQRSRAPIEPSGVVSATPPAAATGPSAATATASSPNAATATATGAPSAALAPPSSAAPSAPAPASSPAAAQGPSAGSASAAAPAVKPRALKRAPKVEAPKPEPSPESPAPVPAPAPEPAPE